MNTDPAPAFALWITVGLLAALRLFELGLSARHLPTLRARGAVERGRSHFAGFVALHTLFPLALALEVFSGGARPPAFWPWLLVPVGLAEVMRIAAMRALGDRWHVRVWVVPGEPPIRRGIYRWLAHPNYVAVVLEFATLPLLFGAWRTAIAASLFNAALLVLRLRVEERALAWAAATPPEPGTFPERGAGADPDGLR
ncbi:MAG: isoprenylcysteine carboxylmethyltransferase family protein [Candidatus Eisenbacteria bacterium]